jgi:ABC-type Fe3+-citrate transport system substrate-binding protein
MNDLAARIADVKQKAEAVKAARPKLNTIYTVGASPRQAAEIDMWNEYISAASPDLILAMAARIEELEKATITAWFEGRFFSEIDDHRT